MKGLPCKPDMVKAIAERRKTVTRRLRGLNEINKEPDKWELLQWKYKMTSKFTTGFFFRKDDGSELVIKPYYRVGETVYVKEPWATEKRLDYLPPSEIGNAATVPLWYKFNDKPTLAGEPERGKWRSPMFMPAWAARYFRKITDVRAERLIIANLSPKEIALEGGQEAIDILKGNDGKWHFRYEFEEAERPDVK